MSTILHSYSKCNLSFRDLLNILAAPVRHFGDQISTQGVSKEYGRYKVWAGNVGAIHRPEKHISLDYCLRDAAFYRDQVIELLDDLRDTNLKAISLLCNLRKPFEECSTPDELSSDSDSDSSSADGTALEPGKSADPIASKEEIKTPLSVPHGGDEELFESEDLIPPAPEMVQIFQSIQDSIQRLYKMSLVIRRPVPQHALDKSSAIDVSHFVDFDKSHVQQGYPCAMPKLQERLANAITRRRQLLLYRERRHEALSRLPKDIDIDSDNVGETTDTVTFSQLRDETMSQQLSANDERDEIHELHDMGIPASIGPLSTEATSFHPPQPRDSGKTEEVESVAGTISSYASTLSGDDDIAIPLCPEDLNEAGTAIFECPLCFYMVEIRTHRQWKRHVFADMQAYACTFTDCETPNQLYETSDSWYNHELQMHRKEWCCNIGDHPPYSSKEEFLGHMRTSHSDAYLEHQLPDVLKMCERPVQQAHSICPLCTDDHEEYVAGELMVRRDQKLVSSAEMRRHLGHHLEQLALFAVPPALRASDEDAGLEAEDQTLSEINCEVCEKAVSQDDLKYCCECDMVYCSLCRSLQVGHNPQTNENVHQQMDPYLARMLGQSLAQPSSNEEASKLIEMDENTSWLSSVRYSSEQLSLIEYGRLNEITSSILPRTTNSNTYPHIVSFMGQTGSGKSTMIRLLTGCQQYRQKPQQIISCSLPAIGSVNRTDPTTRGIHIYADPNSADSHTPFLYAEMEGLDGGAVSRLHTALRSYLRVHELQRPALDIYLGLLYTFLDVVVFVVQSSGLVRLVETCVKQMTELGITALEKPFNQPVVPHAILVLNDNESSFPGGTKSLRNEVIAFIQRPGTWDVDLSRLRDVWVGRGKSVKTLRDLLDCYFRSVEVHEMPRNKCASMYEQSNRLYDAIANGCAEIYQTKREFQMSLDSKDLAEYMSHAVALLVLQRGG